MIQFRVIKITLLVCCVFTFLQCKEDNKNRSSEKVIVHFKKEGELILKKAETDSIVKTIDIEIADNDYERGTGLMYRTELRQEQGMLFIFDNEEYQNFYMKNTKIPLDIIYINDAMEIVSFQKNAQPYNETSLPSEAPAKYVLEINAGLSDAWHLATGDTIEFEKL